MVVIASKLNLMYELSGDNFLYDVLMSAKE